MKKIIVGLFVLLMGNQVRAALVGKLDLLNPQPQTIVLRSLDSGNWMAGVAMSAWELDNTSNGKEILHVNAYQAWQASNGDPVFGLSVGANIGNAGAVAQSILNIVAPDLQVQAPFIMELANITSLDFYGGYRPTPMQGQRNLMYGIGAHINIPIATVTSWLSNAIGSPKQL